MKTDPSDIQHALANESRRQELRQKAAQLRGGLSATSSVMQRLTSINNDQLVELQRVTETLAAFESGSAPGVTEDFGSKSNTTRLLENEREAGNAAVALLCVSSPACTEDEAMQVWVEAAIASHAGFDHVLHDPVSLVMMYRNNLIADGLITENSWAAQRDWLATSSAR